MNDDSALALAFDHAAGLAPSPEGVPESVAAFARRVVAAGRRLSLSPACPRALLRKALALADEMPRGATLPAILRLVFDSWAVAGATRGGGGERILRFEGGGTAIDVELAEEPGGGTRLSGSVEGAPESATLVVQPASGPAIRVPLRAGSSFETRVDAALGRATFEVRAGRKVLLRTPPVPGAG